VAKENLYKDGVSDALYSGYMRNENYTFGIRFFSEDGYVTPLFPMTHRPPIVGSPSTFANTETYVVAEAGAAIPTGTGETIANDVNLILQNARQCGTTRDKKWQFYITATVEEAVCLPLDDGDEVVVTTEIRCNHVVNTDENHCAV